MSEVKLEDYQQRVLEEYHELNKKLDGLRSFLDGEASKEVPSDEISLLEEQFYLMNRYSLVLAIRLCRWGVNTIDMSDDELIKSYNQISKTSRELVMSKRKSDESIETANATRELMFLMIRNKGLLDKVRE